MSIRKNEQLEQSKIKSSVLNMSRKISGAAFNKKLGEHGLRFSLDSGLGVVSMYASTNKNHIDCFTQNSWLGVHKEKTSTWQTSYPKSLIDIPRFESEVETALSEIFEFIKIATSNKGTIDEKNNS